MREEQADIVIIGGSLGGCAAALAAAKSGKKVILTEETRWVGGQLTNQAVPPDEHPWIEKFGCTRSYRDFRNGIRDYYRTHYPLTAEARSEPYLNPGNGYVSRLCHEPKVALAVMEQMLAPYISSERISLLLQHKPVSAETAGDRVISVTVESLASGERLMLTAPYFLDATDCGDVLPLAGVEYVTGSESREQTGEPDALPGEADPLDMQAITWCFAMDYQEGEDHTIDKPDQYDFWRSYQADFWTGKLFSWTIPHYITLEPTEIPLFPGEGKQNRWMYRRLIDKSKFQPGFFTSDITLVNWPQNDYWLGPIFEVSEEEREKHLTSAKQLSLSFLYWMQTEAPRPDGGQGYPGLRLRKDIVGTEDGLAMYPYIRESRRIRSVMTVCEQQISPDLREDSKAERFPDSVGVGCYRIDLHPTTGQRNYFDIAGYPFQIPLGSLIPIRTENLLPACKNIGVTHITNGCYRLHPVEWNIGEASGYLAAYCLEHKLTPRQVREQEEQLKHFQNMLIRQGIELEWPELRPV